MNIIDPSQLENGDILIYENQDFSLARFYSKVPGRLDWYKPEKWNEAAIYVLLYVIAWCDPGKDPKNYKNIYHAAMWGTLKVGDTHKTGVVGAGRNGITLGELHLSADTIKNIYVYRSHQRGFDGTRTDQSLQAFYDNPNISYAYNTAWLLSILCSLRYKDGTLHELIERQVGSSYMANLIVYCIQMVIENYMKQHQDDMVVCSTLVSMAYSNAGFPLRVHPFEAPDMASLSEFVANDLSEQEISETIEPLMTRDFPDIDVPENLITPRQLAESPDVFEVGYLPHQG